MLDQGHLVLNCDLHVVRLVDLFDIKLYCSICLLFSCSHFLKFCDAYILLTTSLVNDEIALI